MASMERPVPPSKPLLTRQRRWTPRTRTGCLTCRNRRVKCDEEKPVCKRCIIAKAPCEGLGYSKIIKHSKKFIAILPKESELHSSSIAPAPPSVPQLNGSADVRDLLDLIPQISKYVNDTFVANPANASTEFILFSGRQLTLYLDFLPSRLDCNESLDQAIASVVCALRDTCLPAGLQCPVKTFSNYTYALRRLQRSLSDTNECLSAEVLCAVHLLGIFETLMRGDKRTSQTHRQGIYRLYELRGPKRFCTDFERTLLISQTPMIFSDQGFSGRSCFLDQQDWMTAISSVSALSTSNFHLSEYKLSRYEFMLPIGRLTRDCNYLALNQDSATDSERLRTALLAELASMQNIIQSWFTRWKSILHPANGVPDVFLGERDSSVVRKNSAIGAKIFTMAYLRYHIAIGGEGDIELERRVLRIAADIAEDSYTIDDASGSYDVAFAGIASATIFETSGEWQKHIEKTKGRGKTIAPEIWSRWLNKWGVFPE